MQEKSSRQGRLVFLSYFLSPRSRYVGDHRWGMNCFGESAATTNGDSEGFLPVQGSFTLVPTDPAAYGPALRSKDLQTSEPLISAFHDVKTERIPGDPTTSGTYDWPDKKKK